MVRASASSLIRIIFLRNAEQLTRVNEELVALGCETEYAGLHRLLAVNVPSSTRLAQVRAMLERKTRAGVLITRRQSFGTTTDQRAYIVTA